MSHLNIDEVVDYLRESPDFLLQNPDVLAAVRLPIQPKAGVVSLVEKQVQALQKQNADLQAHLDALLDYGRANDTIQQQLSVLTMTLWAANDLNQAEVLALASETLSRLFERLHFAVVMNEGELAEDETVAALSAITCGPVLPKALQRFVPAEGSYAIVRVWQDNRPEQTLAFLICSSDNKNHFFPDMGKHHLTRVQEILSLACHVAVNA